MAIRIVVWCLLIGLSPWWSLDRDRLGEASKHQATGQAVRGGGAAFRLNTRKQDLVAGTGDVRSSAAPAKQGPGGDPYEEESVLQIPEPAVSGMNRDCARIGLIALGHAKGTPSFPEVPSGR